MRSSTEERPSRVGELWTFQHPRGGCSGEVWEVISDRDEPTADNAICRKESATCPENPANGGRVHKVGVGCHVTVNNIFSSGSWRLYEPPFATWVKKQRGEAVV